MVTNFLRQATVLVQREMEGGRSLLASIQAFRWPRLDGTGHGFSARDAAEPLNLQLVSKRNQHGWSSIRRPSTHDARRKTRRAEERKSITTDSGALCRSIFGRHWPTTRAHRYS